MKFAVAALALSASISSAAAGGPLTSCAAQSTCIQFTIVEEVDSTVCDGDNCYFKVCMKYVDGPECLKDGSISHACTKNPDLCQVDDGDFSKEMYSGSEHAPIPVNYEMCQLVKGGTNAEFILKDGNACEYVQDELFTVGEYDNVACRAFDVDTETSCTGGGKGSGGECFWSVPVPDCSVLPPPVSDETPITEAPPTETTTVPPPETTATPVPNAEGGGGGDPHFARWGREHDSFHGECDLVMVHSDEFHNGAGFDLHARTKIQDYFSYIESMAMKVGENVLEIHNDHFLLNGVKFTSADLPMTFGGEFKYTISNAPIEAGKNPKYYQYYKVDLHEDSSVLFKFYKKFLTFTISGHSNDFKDSVGLMGEYHTGEMINRDGNVMTDFESYGFEWQVAPTDTVLFSEVRSPQLPYEMCRMPTAARPARRTLRKSAIMAQAQEACAHVTGGDYNLCLDDVAMTGDIGLASLW